MSLVLTGGTLVLPTGPEKADLLLKDKKIAAIAPHLEGDVRLDVSGKLVFPGFIDTHTHFDMNRGQPDQTADDFASGTLAALCGGTTAILDYATQPPGGTLHQALDTWHQRADGVCACHYGFHMAITHWDEHTRSALPAMTAAGVTSYKVYFAYDALRLTDDHIRSVLEAVAQEGGLVGAHCEDGDMVTQGIAHEKALRHLSPAGHPASRPPLCESEAVERWLAMAALVDTPVQVVHLSTAMGLNAIRRARQRGVTCHIETCPQYLLLNDDAYILPGFESAKFVCSPPLRSKKDSTALWQGLSSHEIDTIATDHCSFHYHGAKALGRDDFSKIPNGMPGVEHRPALLYTYGVVPGKLTLTDMARLLAEKPAQLFGMYPQKGALLPGSDGDVVVWDPAVLTTASARTHHHRADYTPYEGFPLQGQAAHVFLLGQEVVRNGQPCGGIRGVYLHRR